MRLGPVIAEKCEVPHLYSFELSGTNKDVMKVRQGVIELWTCNEEQYLQKRVGI